MRIAIVGAGITGIRAAQILEQAGEKPALFEARSYLGGRTKTANPKEQVKYEAGGEWLDSDHCRAIAWIESLGLKSIDIVMVLTAIEEKFDVYIPMDGSFQEAKDLKGLVEAISAHILKEKSEK